MTSQAAPATIEPLERRTLLATTIDFGGGGTGPSEGVGVGDLTRVGDQLYFSAGRSLMRFNPADGESSVVKTFWGAGTVSYPGNLAAFTPRIAPHDLTDVNGTLFFTVDDAAHGRELWKSDGTTLGTKLVADIRVGSAGSDPQQLVALGSKVYFTASDGAAAGQELWSSDGTAAGTKLLANFGTASAPATTYLTHLTAAPAQGMLYFLANDGANGSVYRTNGTGAPTQLGLDDGGAQFIVSGQDVYVLDGRIDNSDPLTRIRRIAPDGSVSTVLNIASTEIFGQPPNVVAFGGNLYFRGFDAQAGRELFVSHGTAGSTKLFKDLNPGLVDSDISQLTVSDNALYFTNTIGSKTTLWRSDGTSAGTIPLKTADEAQNGYSGLTILRAVGKTVYFNAGTQVAAGTGIYTSQLWSTDGTEAGTHRLGDHVIEDGSPLTPMDSHSVYFLDSLSTQIRLSRLKDGKLSSFDVVSPQFNLFAPPVQAAGQKNYAFDVTITSRLGIFLRNVQGLTSNYQPGTNFRIAGPNGFVGDATFLAADRVNGGSDPSESIRTATWLVRGPGGTWDAADAGTYTIYYLGLGEAPGTPPAPKGGLPLGQPAEDLEFYNDAHGAVLGTFTVAPPTTSTVTLTGSVFDDFDGDGTRDASEAGLGGFVVYIDANNNRRLDSGESTSTTDARGHYVFSNLPAAGYTLRLADAQGGLATSRSAGLVPLPGTVAYANFGIVGAKAGSSRTAIIRGNLFDDDNSNAALDAGDKPIANAVVWSDRNSNGVPDSDEPSTRTDSAGNYLLTVPAGDWLIRTDVTGRRYTIPPPDSTRVLAGGSATVNLATTSKAYLTGTTYSFVDENTNSVLRRTQVYLDTNGNGKLDQGEPSLRSSSTGKYRFENLTPGNYVVRANVPAADWTVATGAGYSVRLKPGAGLRRNFVLVHGATIQGTVYNDANTNFEMNGTDPRVAGRTVFVDDNGNGLLDANESSAVTGVDGTYRFVVKPGAVHLALASTPGWRMFRGKSTATLDAGVGQILTTNFATTDKALLVGQIFIDENGNHRFDPGQDVTPDGNVAYLDLNNDHAFEANEPLAGSAGAFALDAAAGTYHVRFSSIDGASLVGPADGYLVTVSAAEVRVGLDFEVT